MTDFDYAIKMIDGAEVLLNAAKEALERAKGVEMSDATIKVSKLVAEMLNDTKKRWEEHDEQKYSISDVIYELITHSSME